MPVGISKKLLTMRIAVVKYATKSNAAARPAGRKGCKMRIEFSIDGNAVTVEAEGAVSLRVSLEGGADGASPSGEGFCEAAWDALWDAPVFTPASAPGVDMQGWREGLAQKLAADGITEERPEGGQEDAGLGDGGLFARLSELRRKLAAEAHVPPYVVFQDKALHEMAEKRPSDLAGLSGISGVGKTRLEKYGELFLAAIGGAAA